MEFFVDRQSVVRKIWGKSDTILFIFAGAAAEFALNKAVDWLYFTGRLPADPIGRLFSTVMYARQIVFSEKEKAIQAIDKISSIHKGVEKNRGTQIPDWAYRDVLFMLIHYSVASFELLERKLRPEEKDEIVRSFARIGRQMHIHDIPADYSTWAAIYESQLTRNLLKSSFTENLFQQYRKHLGAFRYFLLLEIQKMLVPKHVNNLLGLGRPRFVQLLLPLYRQIRKYGLHKPLILMMVPRKFVQQVKAMDRPVQHGPGFA